MFGIRSFGDQTATYLLARWSESQLISFDDIKKEVVKTVSTPFYGLFAMAAVLAILGSMIILFVGGAEKSVAIIPFLMSISVGFLGKAFLNKYRKTQAEIAAA